MEKTLELEAPLLVPGLADSRDRCLERLERTLNEHKGISRAHIHRDQDPPVLCLHYDPDRIGVEDVRRMAQRAGADIANRYHHEAIPVEGMDCSDCALVVEHGVSRMEGVLSASINYAAETLHVEYDARRASRGAIERRIRHLGYDVPAGPVRTWFDANRELLFSLLAGSLLLVGWAGGRFLAFPFALSLALYLAAYAFGGYDVSRHALHALWEREFDTDVLMVLAALGAAALGDFPEGALLLFLFSLGHAMEERALDRARSAIRALADLAPKAALVRRGEAEEEIPVGHVKIGDLVIVRPGVRVSVDGMIESGTSAVDQSPVTGESVPVDKAAGDQVYAGSVNGEGVLLVRATRLAKDSTLARVMKMVEQAQAQKSPTQQLTERFVHFFVPAVLVGDFLLIVVPPFFGVPFATSFLRAMTLLVAASPCALALGTPSAILAGVARAARGGVLVKGGAHLENLGRLRAIAFDKTGTVTRGRPELTDVVALGPMPEDEVLALIAAVESRSAHPIAQAVLKAAQERNLPLPGIGEANALTGRGIEAEVDRRVVRVGNLALFDEAGRPVQAAVRNRVEELEGQGKTTMVVEVEDVPIGLVAVADVLRPETPAAVLALKRIGVGDMVMLTGDNERVAVYIAGQAGMSGFEAGLMPEDKLRAIGDLVKRHGVVAMVGDGVNDAPALASATVGIAMGGAGTDVALETADVALMGDDLSKLPFAVGLGRATRRVVGQNLFVAMGVIVVLMGLAVTGVASIGAAVVFHEGSTILVALNGLRLLGYKE